MTISLMKDLGKVKRQSPSLLRKDMVDLSMTDCLTKQKAIINTYTGVTGSTQNLEDSK